MRGIILAAGRGSRLKNITDDKPKCLVQLAGQPLLNWQLKAMRSAGIERIMVVRGYKGHMVTGDFETCDNHNWDSSNMVASLMCAEKWLREGPCLVSYADIVYSSGAVKKLASSPAELAMLYDEDWYELWSKRFEDPLSDAESFLLDEKGFIEDIGRKDVTLSEIQGQYMGLLKFTPESFDWIKSVINGDISLLAKLDMTSLLQGLIKKGFNIKAVPWKSPWCEIDSADDLAVAERLVASGELNYKHE